MDDNERTCLLAEYAANVELWKHDDDLRQKRTAAFLTVSTILVAILSFVAKDEVAEAPVVALALVGLAFCVIWFFIHLRNAQYIVLRRHQLIHIETKLQCVDTFWLQYAALNKHERVTYPRTGDFEVKAWSKWTSTKIEYAFPVILGLFWISVVVFATTPDLRATLGSAFDTRRSERTYTVTCDKPLEIEVEGSRIVVKVEQK